MLLNTGKFKKKIERHKFNKTCVNAIVTHVSSKCRQPTATTIRTCSTRNKITHSQNPTRPEEGLAVLKHSGELLKNW